MLMMMMMMMIKINENAETAIMFDNCANLKQYFLLFSVDL